MNKTRIIKLFEESLREKLKGKEYIYIERLTKLYPFNEAPFINSKEVIFQAFSYEANSLNLLNNKKLLEESSKDTSDHLKFFLYAFERLIMYYCVKYNIDYKEDRHLTMTNSDEKEILDIIGKENEADYLIVKNNLFHCTMNYLVNDHQNNNGIELERLLENLYFTKAYERKIQSKGYKGFYFRNLKYYEKEKKSEVQYATINSMNDYLSVITGMKNYYSSKDLEYFYRGQINSEWKLEPSIFRNGLIKFESNIYFECLNNLPRNMVSKNIFENLMTIQHYEGPTRLLDITENPLIALFFSCFDDYESHMDTDGIIYIFISKLDDIKYFDNDCVQQVSSLVKVPVNYNNSEIEKSIFSESKDNLIDSLKKSYLVKGMLNNDRIINQLGSFILLGMGDKKQNASSIEQLSEFRIIVKAEAKKEIIRELNLININEATVYPELNKRMKVTKNKWIENTKEV